MADDKAAPPMITHAAMPPTVIRGGKTFWQDVLQGAFILGNGMDALARLVSEDPVKYMKIVTALQPKETAPSAATKQDVQLFLDSLPPAKSSTLETENARPEVYSEVSKPEGETAS